MRKKRKKKAITVRFSDGNGFDYMGQKAKADQGICAEINTSYHGVGLWFTKFQSHKTTLAITVSLYSLMTAILALVTVTGEKNPANFKIYFSHKVCI